MPSQHFAMPDYLQDMRADQTPPIELLRQAASDLAASTGGRVQGNVLTLNPGGSTLFRHTFYLLVPALNDYTYPLFYVWHGPELYPANLLMAGGQQDKDTVVCSSDTILRQQMEDVFKAITTRQLVNSLLVQIGNTSVNLP